MDRAAFVAELANRLATGKASLFAGAGITQNTGGRSWNQLVDEIADSVNFSKPIVHPFEKLSAVVRRAGRPIVEAKIRELLATAKLRPALKDFIGLRWTCIFTTNYDAEIERAARPTAGRQVRKANSPSAMDIADWESTLYIVKAMGSVDGTEATGDAMVLTTADLARAWDQRGSLFHFVGRAFANQSLVVLGYSWRDGVLDRIIDRVEAYADTVKGPHFAIFRSKEDVPPDLEYRLLDRQFHILIADLNDVVPEIVAAVRRRDPADLSRVRFPVGKQVVDVVPAELGPALSRAPAIRYEDLHGEVEPRRFFLGETRQLGSFINEWHFRSSPVRIAEGFALSAVTGKPRLSHLRLEGAPGSGRTFAAAAAVTKVLTSHRCIVFRHDDASSHDGADPADVVRILSSVDKRAAELGHPGVGAVVIWATSEQGGPSLQRAKEICDKSERPVLFIDEGRPGRPPTGVVDQVKVVSLLSPVDLEESGELATFLADVTAKHGLPVLSPAEARNLVEEEKTMLGCLYRTVYHTHESVNVIVSRNLKEMSPLARAITAVAALGGEYQILTPISLCREATGVLLASSSPISWDEFLGAVDGPCSSFASLLERRTGFDALEFHHPTIAEAVAEVSGVDRGAILTAIVQKLELGSQSDAAFAKRLLVENGVNASDGSSAVSSRTVLTGLFRTLSERQPARPVLHHLARLLLKENPANPEGVKLLERALAEPIMPYAAVEPVEYVEASLANALWNQVKHDRTVRRGDPRLTRIDTLLRHAQAADSPTFAPFAIHLAMLGDLARRETDAKLALELQDEGFAIADRLEERGVPMTEEELAKIAELRTSLAGAISWSAAEAEADRQAARGLRHGYYVLALRASAENNRSARDKFLGQALAERPFPAGALSMFLDEELRKQDPRYADVKDAAEELLACNVELGPDDLQRAAIGLYVNGDQERALTLYERSRIARRGRWPRLRVPYFWRQNGSNRIFTGEVVQSRTTDGLVRCGALRPLLPDGIFFDPRKQGPDIRVGLDVTFELGFGHLGPIAFNLKPAARSR